MQLEHNIVGAFNNKLLIVMRFLVYSFIWNYTPEQAITFRADYANYFWTFWLQFENTKSVGVFDKAFITALFMK